MNPKVSVIMIAYNREQFLKDIIQDILNQTFKNFEFIIIDNGSRDGTYKTILKYATLDNRIKVIHVSESSSIGAARNNGVKNSCGEYITFVDDDDRVKDDYISFLYNLIETYNADISICGTLEHDCNETREQCVSEEKLILTPENAIKLLLERKLIRAGMPAKMFHRSIIEKYMFKENCKHEDIHSIYKFLSEANRVVMWGIPKYCFYRHGNNVSVFTSDWTKMTVEQLTEYSCAFHERTEFLEKIFPDLGNYAKYCELSYLLSMCEKICKYGLKDCNKKYEEFRNRLYDEANSLLNGSFIKEFEKEWMQKYILER